MTDRLYRYTAHMVSNGYDEYSGSRPEVTFHEYVVEKVTKKGYWIYIPYSTRGKRWVAFTGKKRFAHETKREALQAAIIRKQYSVGHCKRRLSDAEKQLHALERTTV